MNQAEDVFRTFYEQYYQSLGHFFTTRGAPREVSRDLVQETFLRVFRSLTAGNVREPGRAWIFTIALNVWKNHIRWQSAAKRRGVEIDLDELPREPFYTVEFEDSAPGEVIPELLYKKPAPRVGLEAHQESLLILDDELIRYLKVNPEKMRELSPRRFEELVASLLEDLGYVVELTSQGADGGVDIFATQKNELGDALVIVDCKRYSPEKRVGVGLVRALYGLSESFRATKALLATTSFFTRPAIAFEAQVPYRLGLRDYNALVGWLNEYRKERT